MKFNHKITLDMFEFLVKGKFDCIELGQTQEWILNNFPDPNYYDGKSILGSEIWQYGKIEFHFYDNKLEQIFSDHFQSNYLGKKFNAGDEFIVKPWIFKNPKKLTLDYVMRKFVKLNIDFEKRTTSYSIELILKSGVKLIFQNPNDSKNKNPNRYLMMAFVLN
ncbi:hypothetical protein [Moraxella oblonga]|uniref:hypothetical protein n=1 Tax=Moraxella oblonga TaxID=200413 RepID=UPI0008314096|nr:hypothetical protein [Moraxella oblonga]